MDDLLFDKLKDIDKELRKNLSDEKINNRVFMNHYTSPEGLKGILSNHELWFSNAKFLNDKTETNYIYSILPINPDPYDLLLDGKFFGYIRNIADSFLKDDTCDIDDICISPTDFYIASFSQDEDNLEIRLCKTSASQVGETRLESSESAQNQIQHYILLESQCS